jgi:hypothetical protein
MEAKYSSEKLAHIQRTVRCYVQEYSRTFGITCVSCGLVGSPVRAGQSVTQHFTAMRYLLGILFIARKGRSTRMVLIADRFMFSTFKQYSKALKQTDGSTVRLCGIKSPLIGNVA